MSESVALNEWITEVVRQREAEWPHHVMEIAYHLSHKYNRPDSDAGVAYVDVQNLAVVVLLRPDATVRQANDWGMRIMCLEAEPIESEADWFKLRGRYHDVPVIVAVPKAALIGEQV